MNAYTVASVRKFLFYSVSDAAKYVGNVDVRTWRKYESGALKAPSRVIFNLNDMLSTRTVMLKFLTKNSIDPDGTKSLTFYPNVNDWTEDAYLYKIYCSAVASIVCMNPEVKLIRAYKNAIL